MYKKLFFLLIITSLVACKTQPENSLQRSGKITDDKTLDSYFQKLQEKNMFNGAVAVKQNGKLILKNGYGKANFRFNEAFSPATPMEVASISKQFTAAAVLLLEQQKKLDTDDSVQHYLGEDFPYSKISIKHLLTHTSGLANYADYFRKNWDTTQIVYNKDILTYFKTEKPALESVPGEKYNYSNSGYVLLAEIVKEISGQPLDEFLEENIFEPAQMESSEFYERDSIWNMRNYAPAYMIDIKNCNYTKPEKLPGKNYYTFLSGRLGPGRLSASVNDLVKWDSILTTNKLLKEKTKQKIFQVYMPEKDSSDYGFGWHIYNDDQLGKVVYHTGSWAGNLTYIKRFVDEESLIIIIDNTYNKAYIKEIRNQIEGYLKGEPLQVPKLKLEYVLQREICNLNTKNIYAWYKSLENEIEVSFEALKKLQKKYKELGESEKADLVETLTVSIKSRM